MKTTTAALAFALFAFAATAAAADAPKPSPSVPAIAPAASAPAPSPAPAPVKPVAPPPVNLLSGKDARLSHRERTAVSYAKEWINGTGAMGRGPDGSVVYRYGGPIPTLICSPLEVCSIDLQPGEVVNQIDVGDAVRWLISPATSGPDNNTTTHVVVKVTDSDLHSSLLINTNRRAYTIKLVSTLHDWMPHMSFTYPEDAAQKWVQLQHAEQKERAATVLPDTGQNLADLDFSYSLGGDRPAWRPVRVYAGGGKTYIQFPASMSNGDAPALLAMTPSGQQMVNYRVKGDVYVVDKVLQDAELVSGVGRHQVRVTIKHEGGR